MAKAALSLLGGGADAGQGSSAKPGAAGSGDGQGEAAKGKAAAGAEGAGGGGGGGGNGDGGPDAWYKALPEAAATDKVKRFDSLEKFVSSYNDAQTLIDKKGYLPPGDDATPEQVEAWHKHVGRPEKPELYDWKPGEGRELDPAAIQMAQQKAHKLGLTRSQFAGVMDLYAEDVQRMEDAAAEEQDAAYKEAEETLSEEWGDALQEKIESATRMSKTLGINEVLHEHGLSNNTTVLKALVKMAEMVSEDTRVTAASGKTKAADEIKRLKETDEYKDARHPGRPGILKKIEEWYIKQAGESDEN